MDKEAFIEKIKKEGFWDTVYYDKKWNGYDVFIVGMDGNNGFLGEEQVILVKDDIERYATEIERLTILDYL